jgi:hypothetical protein
VPLCGFFCQTHLGSVIQKKLRDTRHFSWALLPSAWQLQSRLSGGEGGDPALPSSTALRRCRFNACPLNCGVAHEAGQRRGALSSSAQSAQSRKKSKVRTPHPTPHTLCVRACARPRVSSVCCSYLATSVSMWPREIARCVSRCYGYKPGQTCVCVSARNVLWAWTTHYAPGLASCVSA